MTPELEGVIVGAAITSVVPITLAIVQFISAWRQRKTDERIKYREALFKLAFNWHAELGRRNGLVPLEEYLIRMDSIAAIFTKEHPSTEKLAATLDAFSRVKEEWAKRLPPSG